MDSFYTIALDLIEGFVVNCNLFFITLLIAIPLGLIVTLGTMSKFSPLRYVLRTFVWIIRGTPLMLQLFVVLYAPGLLFDMPMKERLLAAYIAFAINYAAYFAEIYRSGIESMPIGQYEAAEVLGYSKAQTFFTIILPQVIKRILPSVTNEIITLVKDTSLAFAIAQAEMFTIAKQIAASETSMVPLALAGVFYYIFNLIVATIMENVEKAFSYYR